MLNAYELVLIASGCYDEHTAEGIREAQDIYDRYVAYLKEHTLKLTHESWGRKKLAYPIKGQDHGWYYLFEFTTSEDRLDKILEKVNADPNIIKHIAVRKDTEVDDDESSLEELERAECESECDETDTGVHRICEQDYPGSKPVVDVFDLIFGIEKEEVK